MSRWLLVVLAACSSKKAAPPPPAPAPPAPPAVRPDAAIPHPAMRSSKPIDLPDTAITRLELRAVLAERPGGYESLPGVFEVRWHAPSPQDVDVVCRIEAYNLAGSGKRDDLMVGQYNVTYRPDPFVLSPKVCEVRFLDPQRKVVARACYQDGTMTAGSCAAGELPPAKMPEGMAVDVQGASAHLMPRTLELRALITAGTAQQPELAVRCEGIDGAAPVPLPAIDAGETRYIVASVTMQKPLAADPKQCELRVLGNGKTLGTFCIAEGSTEPGPCAK